MKTLAERLVWAREKKEWTQDQLASEAGVSQSTIGNIEAGIRETPRKLAQIAYALGISAIWLAERKGEPFLTDKGNAPLLARATLTTPLPTEKQMGEWIMLLIKSPPDLREALIATVHGMTSEKRKELESGVIEDG